MTAVLGLGAVSISIQGNAVIYFYPKLQITSLLGLSES
jgi:hypothetical protein